MKSKAPLKITIPRPCQENWEDMAAAQDGRFCTNCQKVVVDFTGLSDSELYNYIQTTPNTCGRFYADQTERPILPVVYKNHFLQRFSKIAAAIFTFLSLKNVQAANPTVKVKTDQQSLPAKQYGIAFSDTMNITGRVVDKDGQPLYGAEILWDGAPITKTDSAGQFRFKPILTGNPRSHIINFIYPDLVSTLRSYHPAMGETSYSIVLSPPADGRRIIMGGISDQDFEINMPPLYFKYPTSQLTTGHKSLLATLATNMRNHPGVPIELTGGGRNQKEINRIKSLQQALKDYLINKEGIGADRINLKIISYDPALKDSIEIRNCTKE